MGHGEAGRVGVDEGEGLFIFSLKTSSFTTDKSDRWKPIKKKSYSQVPGIFGEVPQFCPLLCSNCWGHCPPAETGAGLRALTDKG